MFLRKVATEIESPDAISNAAASPASPPSIVPTIAPGKQGVSSFGAKTNYTRVNTGTIPVSDPVGAAQKSSPPRGAEMLPKMAMQGGEVFMAGKVTTRPMLQDLVKTAMRESLERGSIAHEARLQQQKWASEDGDEVCEKCGKTGCSCKEKAASAASVGSVPVEKLASALDYLAGMFLKHGENTAGPGEGPTALHVMEAESETALPAHMGQGRHTVPMHTGLQKGLSSENVGTQVPNNLNDPPASGQEAPMTNYGKQASVANFLLNKMANEEEAMQAAALQQAAQNPQYGLLNRAGAAVGRYAPELGAVGGALTGGTAGALGGVLLEGLRDGGNANGALKKALIGGALGSALGGAQGYVGGHLMQGATRGLAEGRPKMAEDAALERRETKGMNKIREGLEEAATAHAQEEKEAGAREAMGKAWAKVKEKAVGAKNVVVDAAKATQARQAVKDLRRPLLEHETKGPHRKYHAKELAKGVAKTTGLYGGVGAAGYGGYRAATHGKKNEEGIEHTASIYNHVLESIKAAEDAINPARISAGPAAPPETSAAGEPGGAPVGGMPMGPRGLVHSNDSAINYKRQAAYSNRKEDLKKYFAEPALTQSTDSVLSAAFSHSGEAGSKMASADSVPMSVKTAAGRALLMQLAEQVVSEKQRGV